MALGQSHPNPGSGGAPSSRPHSEMTILRSLTASSSGQQEPLVPCARKPPSRSASESSNG
eukprot:9180522-Alexandrium_andersonii.AAC.1